MYPVVLRNPAYKQKPNWDKNTTTLAKEKHKRKQKYNIKQSTALEFKGVV